MHTLLQNVCIACELWHAFLWDFIVYILVLQAENINNIMFDFLSSELLSVEGVKFKFHLSSEEIGVCTWMCVSLL